MHDITLLFYMALLSYPHLFLGMTYVGLQRFRNLFVVFLGTVLGGNILIFLMSHIIIRSNVSLVQFENWWGQRLAYIFLFLYTIIVLGNLSVIHALWKKPNVSSSSWGWFKKSFAVGLCIYGPSAFMRDTMRPLSLKFEAVAYFLFLGGLIGCICLFQLSTFVLDWVGVSKEKSKAHILYGIRWVLILACSIAIAMNLGDVMVGRPPAVMFGVFLKSLSVRETPEHFEKKLSRKSDLSKEPTRLDSSGHLGEG